MKFAWEKGFTIAARIDGEKVIISANREGLVSLAHHLLALADEIPRGHFHLDEHNSLEDGSCELVFERVE